MTKRISLLLAITAILGLNQQANASGFALIEQSVSSMGNAYAGGAAIAEDASTIFFNPAGITRLCGSQFVGGFHVIIPVADYDDKGSIVNPLVGAGPVQPNNFNSPFPLTGNDGKDAGEAAVVAHSYFTRQINDCWWVGLAITSPFGLVTDYDNNWKGRYHALRSSLLTIDINPVVAYKINSCWSVGGGFRAVYAHAKLSNNVDYGTIAWLQTLTLGGGAAAAQTGLNNLPEHLGGPFLPTEEDGRVHLKGNAWGYGGNFGVLYEPCCGTRYGFNWRSQVKLNVTGSERFSRRPLLIEHPEVLTGTAFAGLIPLFQGIKAAAATDSRAKSDVILPDLFEFSAYHEINRCWAVMADISWTRWKLLEELRFTFNNPNQADGVTTLKWQNSMRYALGVTYSPYQCWKFRTGIAYDETPVKNKESRTPRIPDEDRFWTTIGAGYDWSQCVHFDFGYAHLFVRTPKIDKSDFSEAEDAVRGGLKGEYDAYTDIISAQMVWSF